ncbi:MAG: hypothetical protein U9N87_12105, partial [Planctomycetota bacterium]|nr:hypothetical protein [Planctomycetota bacterium]
AQPAQSASAIRYWDYRKNHSPRLFDPGRSEPIFAWMLTISPPARQSETQHADGAKNSLSKKDK